MNDHARRPFWLALFVSLLLHAAALTSPGWSLPFSEDESPERLEATLAVPRPPSAAPVVPPPRPKPAKKVVPVPVAGDSVPAPQAAAAPAEPPSPQPEPPPPPAVPADIPLAVQPAPTFVHAEIWPRQGRVVFQVTRGEGGLIVGQAEHTWHHDGTNYELRAVTETVGLAALFRPARVSQESRGSFAASGLQPLEFRAERDNKPKDSLRFDYTTGQLTLTNGLNAAFPAGTQDLLSLFYQLGAYSFELGEFPVSVSTGRKIAYFVVAVSDAQKLDSPLGERSVRHLKITGTAREDFTEIWVDTQTRLPLKIRHRDRKGEIFDQIATAIELDTSP